MHFVTSSCLPPRKYFGPDYELDVRPSNMENANSYEYLEKIKTSVIENLKRTAFAPSVQMTDVPRDIEGYDDDADAILDDLDDDENKDSRHTKRRWDKYVEKEGELSESDDEEEAAANGVRKQPGATKRRNIMDYRNPSAPDYPEDSAAASPENMESSNGAEGTLPNFGTNSGAGVVNESRTVTPAQGSKEGELADTTVDIDGDVDMEHTVAAPEIEARAVRAQVTPPLSPPEAANAHTAGAPLTPPTQSTTEANEEAGGNTSQNQSIPNKVESSGNRERENVEGGAKIEEEVTIL